MKYATLVLTINLVTCVSVWASEKTNTRISNLLGSSELYEPFHVSLVEAVEARKIKVIAKLIHYPLIWNRPDGSVQVKSENEFIEKYPLIFSAATANSILEQEYEDIFVNYPGISYGRGYVWASEICSDDSLPGECTSQGVKILQLTNLPYKRLIKFTPLGGAGLTQGALFRLRYTRIGFIEVEV